MITKIIDKKVVFEDLTIVKNENNVDKLSFEIERFYKDVDLNLLTAYFKFLRNDGYDDKIVMTKALKSDDQNKIIISVEITSSMTKNDGDISCEISFENAQGQLFNTEIFYLTIKNSITGIDSIVEDEDRKVLEEYLKKSEFEVETEKALQEYLSKNEFEVEKKNLISNDTLLKNQIVSGTVVAGKAVKDQKGNVIDLTYQKALSGKGLSSNDYTNNDKQKVDKILLDGNGSAFLANDGSYKEISVSGDVSNTYVGGEGVNIEGSIISLENPLTAEEKAKIALIDKDSKGDKFLADDGNYKDIDYNEFVTFAGLTEGERPQSTAWAEKNENGYIVGQWALAVAPLIITTLGGEPVLKIMDQSASYISTRFFIKNIAFSGANVKCWISIKKEKDFTDATTFEVLGWDGVRWESLANLTAELNKAKSDGFYDLPFTFKDKNYESIQIFYKATSKENVVYVKNVRVRDSLLTKEDTEKIELIKKDGLGNKILADDGSYKSISEAGWTKGTYIYLSQTPTLHTFTFDGNAKQFYVEGFLYDNPNKDTNEPTGGSSRYIMNSRIYAIPDEEDFVYGEYRFTNDSMSEGGTFFETDQKVFILKKGNNGQFSLIIEEEYAKNKSNHIKLYYK